ncbi:hypothetical protein NVP1121O_179 [Vibrio phage 1.121.O._10N.286.46.C4]|nr:hypothetical protein NVP1121O_179 [Vibrio phage 1.121.O._10N.286.46.C4]
MYTRTEGVVSIHLDSSAKALYEKVYKLIHSYTMTGDEKLKLTFGDVTLVEGGAVISLLNKERIPNRLCTTDEVALGLILKEALHHDRSKINPYTKVPFTGGDVL